MSNVIPSNNATEFKPHLKTGIVLVNVYGEVLLVKRTQEETVLNGQRVLVPIEGDGKWSLPCGFAKKGLKLESAASIIGGRESLFDFDIEDVCYIGSLPSPIATDICISVMFKADQPYDISQTDNFPEWITGRGFFSFDKIWELYTTDQLCDRELVVSAVCSAQAGMTIPEEVVAQYGTVIAN